MNFLGLLVFGLLMLLLLLLVVVPRSGVICWRGVGRVSVVFTVGIVGHFCLLHLF